MARSLEFGASHDGQELMSGMSRMQRERMQLDAHGAPALLDLRMNYRNLLNEMNLNGNKIISHQFALMKPRRKSSMSALGSPRQLEPPPNCDVALYKRVAKKKAKEKQRKEGETMEFKHAITCLFEEHNPEKLRTVDALLEKYRASLPDLYCRICTKYNVAPHPDLLRTPQDQKEPKTAAKDAEDAGILFELDDDDNNVMHNRDPTAALEVQDMMHDEKTAAVFSSLQDKKTLGFIDQSCLPRALEALGVVEPDDEQCRAVVKTLVRFDPKNPEMQLAFDEFCAVVWSFVAKRQGQLREMFKSVDRDATGSISSRELRHLIWDLGFNVEEKAVEEIIAEVDANASGQIELPEFENALRIVHSRHGFTKAEAQELLDIFDRYDVDKSGALTSCEVASALGWFGTPTTIREAKEIIRKYDQDVDGTLCRCEFMLVMRSRLEEEISKTRALFANFDTQSRGFLETQQLSDLMRSLGYTVPAEVLAESIKELGPNATKALIFEDVCKVTQTIRKRNGFSKSELAELMEMFRKFDKREQGEMREFELAHALNWVGYPVSHQRRRNLWCLVDMNKSNSIDQGEFLKLVRMLREEETNMCSEFLERRSDSKRLKDKHVRDLVNHLGYTPSDATLQIAFKEYCVGDGDGLPDLLHLLSMLRYMRECQVANLRECAGLKDDMTNRIKHKFKSKLDAKRRIDPSDFERFMYDVWKSARSDFEEREKVKALIRDHCVDGALGLQDMYWVVRLYGDMLEEGKVDHVKSTAAKAGFNDAQVAEFKGAFLEADADGGGDLDEDEISALFDQVASLNPEQSKILKREMERLGEKRDHIDFQMFLELMSAVCNGSDSD